MRNAKAALAAVHREAEKRQVILVVKASGRDKLLMDEAEKRQAREEGEGQIVKFGLDPMIQTLVNYTNQDEITKKLANIFSRLDSDRSGKLTIPSGLPSSASSLAFFLRPGPLCRSVSVSISVSVSVSVSISVSISVPMTH